MEQGKLKRLLESLIRKVVSEEIEKSQVALRKEMYILINEVSNQKSVIVNSNKPTHREVKSLSSIQEILSSVSPFSSTEIDQNYNTLNTDNITTIIDVPEDIELKTPVKKIVDVLNNTDFAAKAKAMEEAARKRREML